MSIFKDEYVPNVQSANKTSYAQWKQSNPGEAAKWESYRDAVIAHESNPKGTSPTPPSLATKYGKALVAAGKLQVSVTDIGADYTPTPEPPPPPPANIVFPADNWTDLSNPPWTAMFDYGGTPSLGTGVTSSPTGRVSVVSAPDGVGRALRTEIRDSDPGWANNTGVDRAHLQTSSDLSWGQPQINVGDVFYFNIEMWLPLNNPVGDYFDYPRGQFYRIMEPHESTGTRWSCFSLISDGLPTNNAWFPIRLAGGNFPSTAVHYPLFQLTNSDGSWHTQNFNRRLNIRYGGRFAPDSTGWFEAWVDGGQVIPRTFRPTMWTGDYAQYLQIGQYKAHGDPFPHYGKSVIYYLDCTVEKG